MWQRGKRQISAEKGLVEKQEEKAENCHKQSELNPDRVLLGLQLLKVDQFP